MSAWPSPIRSAATFLVTAILLSVVAVEGPPRCVLLVYQDDGIKPTSVVFEQSLAQPLRAQLGANLDFYLSTLNGAGFPMTVNARLSICVHASPIVILRSSFLW